MNRSSPSSLSMAPRPWGLAPAGTIEWEAALPLAPRLVPVGQAARQDSSAAEFNSAWSITMPAELAAAPQPQPFREAIRGLVTREMDEPELFRHFFG